MTATQKLAMFILGFVVLILVVLRTVFTVYPWQHAIVLQFGEIIDVKSTSGLFFKLPWQNTLYLDSRILTIDALDADRFITTEKENLLVDSFIKWRIEEPGIYYQSVRGDESQAQIRLLQIINRSLRDEIGKRTVRSMVSEERDEVMEILRERATETASELGIQVLDVRIKRVELPQQVSENVYLNMIEERRRVANERRSTGDAEKERIRAEADKERTIILAEAQREAEIIKGNGDAEAAAIYSAAFGEYQEFYAFHRSLEAYRNSFSEDSDFMVLDSNTDFFRYFKDQFGDYAQEEGFGDGYGQ